MFKRFYSEGLKDIQTWVLALQNLITVVENGDPTQWKNFSSSTPNGPAVQSESIIFGGITYNQGLVTRVYKVWNGGTTDSNKTPFVFLLLGKDDWNNADKLLLDKTRGKYTEWDPRLIATGQVIMEKDGVIAVKTTNVFIKVDDKPITEAGNWDGWQTFEMKLSKGVHVINVQHMNWMAKKFSMEIVDKITLKPVLYHLPKNLIAETTYAIKSKNTVTPSELVVIPASEAQK